MTSQLSSEAQAVLDAYRSTHLSINNLVAALRAAANEMPAVQWPGQLPLNAEHQLGINWAHDALHAIANELEISQKPQCRSIEPLYPAQIVDR